MGKRKTEDAHGEFVSLIHTVYGSLVQSHLILNGIRWTEEELIAKFKKARLPFVDDPEFIRKTLGAVGLDYEDLRGKPLAVCENELNTLFCPYLITEEGFALCPLERNGRLTLTQVRALSGDSYKIIDWDTIEED